MNKRIIYFAGFKGHRSNKFEIIKEFFTTECVQFDQTLDFAKDIIEIENLIENHQAYIIASSMGCLTALYTHFKYNCPIVLINPSLFPDITLKEVLSDSEIESIRNIRACLLNKKTGKEINLYIAEDDERVNHDRFIEQFEENIRYINRSPIGGHSYTILPDKLHAINVSLFRAEIDFEDFCALYEDKMAALMFEDIE